MGLHRRQQDAGVFASVAKLRRCEGLIVYKSGLIWFQNRNSSVCQKAFSYVQESPELYYRQHFLAGPGWLRLHFDYRLPFSTISGWLRLPLQTTDYTCTISTNFRVARGFFLKKSIRKTRYILNYIEFFPRCARPFPLESIRKTSCILQTFSALRAAFFLRNQYEQ